MYSPGVFVPAAQYIIELVCEKKAAFSKQDLPPKFWNLPHWEKYFKMQLRKCHALLKKYDEKAIIAAIKKSKSYSLLPKWVEPIIAEEQRLLEAKRSTAKVEGVVVPATNPILKKREIRKNTLSLLKDLDNGEEEKIRGNG